MPRLAAGLACLLLLCSAQARPSSSRRRTPHGDAANECTAALVDGYVPPSSARFIEPQRVVPAYQWLNNNGYCEELSLIQAMSTLGGTWMSQWNARAVCGAQLAAIPPLVLTLDELIPKNTPPDVPLANAWVVGMPLNQSGPPGWCEAFGDPNYNAQVEFEPVGAHPTGVVSGPADYASSPVCLANSRIQATIYDGISQPAGEDGYRHFISWIKARLIAGEVVSIGVYDSGCVHCARVCPCALTLGAQGR